MSTDTPTYAANWYPDPHAPGQERYFDGSEWTEQRRPAAQPPSSRTSGLAIAALVTGLLCMGIVAIVLGILALRSISKAQPPGSLTGRGLAIAGIITGAIGILVIMVLMAVAVPTFLAQKDKAMATKARANVMQIRNAIESCATQNTDGTLTGCDARGVAEDEPSVAQMLEAGCDEPDGACVKLMEDDRGYRVGVRTSEAPTALFTFEQRSDGQVVRECEPSGVAGCPATGSW